MRPEKENFRLSDGVRKPDRNFAFSGRIRPRRPSRYRLSNEVTLATGLVHVSAAIGLYAILRSVHLHAILTALDKDFNESDRERMVEGGGLVQALGQDLVRADAADAFDSISILARGFDRHIIADLVHVSRPIARLYAIMIIENLHTIPSAGAHQYAHGYAQKQNGNAVRGSPAGCRSCTCP